MSSFLLLKYTFIIFAAHLITSRCAPFENRCYRGCTEKKNCNVITINLDFTLF
jgi:hypothetical protein